MPDDTIPIPPRGGNPRTAPIGSPSAEFLALCRVMSAARCALKLIDVHIGRVLVAGTGPPVESNSLPPDFATPQADAVEPREWNADSVAIYAGQMLGRVQNAEHDLFAFLKNTEEAQELAREQKL